MRGMLALLSTHEEAALRKIGFGSGDPLEAQHVHRLLQLELIEWNGLRWTLTGLERRRYDSLVCIDKESVKVRECVSARGAHHDRDQFSAIDKR